MTSQNESFVCLGSSLSVIFSECSSGYLLVSTPLNSKVHSDIKLLPSYVNPYNIIGAIILPNGQNQSDNYSKGLYSIIHFQALEIGDIIINLCRSNQEDNASESFSDLPCTVLTTKVVSVVDCNVTNSKTLSSFTNHEQFPKPSWSIRGVAAIGETKGIRIPHDNLPVGAQHGKSWSMSFWAYFLKTKKTQYMLDKNILNRVLFYRGTLNPGDQSRTPSAWFDKTSNRLLLRCSTMNQSDLGATSIGSLAMQEWVHLSFVFTNHSVFGLTETGRASFTYKMFINGQLDSEMTFASPLLVESNRGALYIGKTKDFPGTPALLSRVQLFDGELSHDNIKTEYDSYRFVFHRHSQDSVSTIYIHPSFIQDMQLLRGVVDATYIFSAWGEQTDGNLLKVNKRRHYLDNLLNHANSRLSTFMSTSEFEAWEMTLEQFGIEYDPLIQQFFYSIDSSVYTELLTEIEQETNTPSESSATFHHLVSKLHDCKADDFEKIYIDINEAARLGVPSAISLLADFDQQPLRDTCPDELRRKLQIHMKPLNPFITSKINKNVFSSLISVFGSISNRNQSSSISKRENLTTRNETRARIRRIHAASKGDAHSLYMLGVDYMTFGTPFSSSLIPTSFDDSFGLGFIHLSSALDEPFAWQLLSRKYAASESGISSITAFVTKNHVSSKYLDEKVAKAQERLYFGNKELLNINDVELVNQYFSKYQTGVPIDIDLAVFYAEWASDFSEQQYHLPTGRPLHEMHRLNIDSADSGEIEKNQRGSDEPEIAFQRYRCEHQLEPHACAATGDLFSWGSRGINRDLAQAYRYYNLGSELGDLNSKVSLAQMLLKGEGVERNALKALILFEDVVSKSNQTSITVRALNGLGFAHFHGIDKGDNTTGLIQNQSLALTYFQKSSALGDGDATFNLGMCHSFGFGTQKNESAALEAYSRGVNLGHFDCILALGRSYAQGSTLQSFRDAPRALPFLTASSSVGPWSGLLRRGFDRYLAHDYDGAFLHYIHSHLLGNEIGTANAAYLLRRNLVRRHQDQQNLSFLLHQYSFSRNGDFDSALALADFYLHGEGGAKKDSSAAIALYERASSAGSPQAAFSLGLLYEEGADGVTKCVEHAEKYYNRALFLSNNSSSQHVVRLALLKLSARKWLSSLVEPFVDTGDYLVPVSQIRTLYSIVPSTSWLQSSVFRLFSASSVNDTHEAQRLWVNTNSYYLICASMIVLSIYFIRRNWKCCRR
jgi:TPR repeat protein